MKLIMENWRSFVNENKNPCDCKACFEYFEYFRGRAGDPQRWHDLHVAARAAGCFERVVEDDPPGRACRVISARYNKCRTEGGSEWDCDPCKEVS